MSNVDKLTTRTEELISEINYIMKHINRCKLSRESVIKLQNIRDYLERELKYYRFINNTKSTIDQDMYYFKSRYINDISLEINMFKRIVH